MDFFNEYFFAMLAGSDLNCTVWNSVSYWMTRVCLSLICVFVSLSTASFSRNFTRRVSTVRSSTIISFIFSFVCCPSSKLGSNLKLIGLGGEVLFFSTNSRYSSDDLMELTPFSILA